MVGAPHMLGTQGPRNQLLCTHIPGDCPRGTDEVWCYQLEGLRRLWYKRRHACPP